MWRISANGFKWSVIGFHFLRTGSSPGCDSAANVSVHVYVCMLMDQCVQANTSNRKQTLHSLENWKLCSIHFRPDPIQFMYKMTMITVFATAHIYTPSSCRIFSPLTHSPMRQIASKIGFISNSNCVTTIELYKIDLSEEQMKRKSSKFCASFICYSENFWNGYSSSCHQYDRKAYRHTLTLLLSTASKCIRKIFKMWWTEGAVVQRRKEQQRNMSSIGKVLFFVLPPICRYHQ